MSRTPKIIYIAGERQHAGKTVSTLGLFSALCSVLDPADIGYFKPVGQEMVQLPSGERIDKDIMIVKEFTGMTLPDLGILSPVRVSGHVTRDYLTCDDPRQRTEAYERAILRAIEHLSDKKLIIAEGTGHPGVGSVVGLSNARVANLLKARILYLVGGGIGKPVDELEVDLSYFSHKRSQVLGVLFNKVLPSKIEMMKRVLSEESLHRIFPEWHPPLQVFGYIPEVSHLGHPSMELVAQQFKTARLLNEGCTERWYRSCAAVNVISQGNHSFRAEEHLQPRDIAVLGAGSHRRLKKIVKLDRRLGDTPLGGLILNCAGNDMPDARARDIIAGSQLPVIAVEDDAGQVDQKLYRCFVNTKLQTYDRRKFAEIQTLFADHFDARRFVRSMDL
jgi:hypothetical protein